MTVAVDREPLVLTADQRAAFERFGELRVGAVFMEQGMGKSRVALELADFRADRLDAVLWVAPCSVVATVDAEVRKWGCRLPVRTLGYETLSQSDTTYLEVLEWAKSRRLLLIADESTFIKNVWAARSQRMVALRKHADYALALNGTPLTRDLWDIKRQMDFLSPRILDTDDRAYQRKYFTECRRVDEFGNERVWYEDSARNIAHLQSLMAPYVYEAKLDIGVPESELHLEHKVSMESAADYQEARDLFLQEWESSAGSDIVLFQLLINLTRIAANDQEKCASVGAAVRGRHCLVFCNYLHEQELIADAAGPHLAVSGEVAPDERAAIFERSRTEAVPLILTYGVGAFGLNLQHIAEVHFASPTFNYGRTVQAKSRVRRLGQTRPIAYTYHSSTLGIDQLIAANHHRKAWLAELLRHKIDPRGII